MPEISIVSLIYKSTRFADWIWESAHKYTEELKTGEAEFFFVANDATDEVKKHLKAKGYKHFINDNPQITEEELKQKGYGDPLYIHYVYRGWNHAIKSAETDLVCLTNSDMFFSPDWLYNLKKHILFDQEFVVSSQLIERPQNFTDDKGVNHSDKWAPFANKNTGGRVYIQYFGNTIDNFQEQAFVEHAQLQMQRGSNATTPGIAYMPLLMRKEHAEKVGFYSEGNVPQGEFNDHTKMVYGDESFIKKLEESGIKHITSLDSIVYHLKEGEQSEV